MGTVDQPTAAPTEKLNAATIGAAASALVYALVANRWPLLKDPVIWIPVAPAASALVAFIAGWLRRERDAFSRRVERDHEWMVLIGGIAVLAACGFVGWALFGAAS